MFFFQQPNLLTDEDVLKSISAMPHDVIDIIELYNIDVKKYVSYNSGLLQTEPILKNYNLLPNDRKILIEYAMKRTKVLAKKEKELLSYLKKDIDSGDFTFVQMYHDMAMRCDMRKKDIDLSDLYKVKYRKSEKVKAK
jgi:hypothetical protein